MTMEQTTICHPNNPCNNYYGKCLDVKITNCCNGKCAFCIERGGYSPPPAPVERLIEATNQLTDYQTVLILGGEPFMYPHLEEYLAGIQEKREIFITTNGSCFITEQVCRIAHLLTAVNISIHHYDQKVNSSVFGTDISFERIEKAISLLKTAAVKVRVNTNLIKGLGWNRSEIVKMFRFARSLGADEIRFSELQNCPEYYCSARDLLPDLPEEPFSQGCEHELTPYGSLKVFARQTCGLVNSACEMPEKPARKGSSTKVLYPDGTVLPGWFSNEHKAGDRKKGISSTCHRGCH